MENMLSKDTVEPNLWYQPIRGTSNAWGRAMETDKYNKTCSPIA